MTRHPHSAPSAWRRRCRALRDEARRDDGTTLLELTVGMALMAVFMVIFTGAIMMMFNAMKTSQTVNNAAAQVNTAFLQLDESVRSASYIGTPGQANGSWYVEYKSLDSTGQDQCTQLRVTTADQQLQSRTWRVVNATPTAPSAWRPIASGVSNGAGAAGTRDQPFVLGAGAGSTQFQQLVVTLVPTAGPGATTATRGTQFTVTALNSVLPAPATNPCAQVRP
ncbi:PilW family protein [Nakamurella deserti]|uniref:PilW family protein n=1 Tax=Nakamurella deserti TaxID=2164074 RepID=UPI000DBE44E9|nr:hypothetical protein [Nakamurella deserti]